MTVRSLKPLVLAGLALLAIGASPAQAQDAGETIRAAADPISLSQPRAVTSLDIDPGGETLAVSGLDGAVRLWSLATGAAGPVFPIHQGDAAAVRFTADGRRLLSTGADGQVALLDAGLGTRVRTWRFPTWCLGLAVVDADTVAVGCADLKIRILNLGDDRVVREIQAPGDLQYQYVVSLSASPDGRLLASNNPLTLYDVETGEQRGSVPSFAQRVTFSPDGRSLLGGSMKAGASVVSVDPLQGRARLVTDVEQQVQTPSGRQAARQGMPIYGVVWSPDGRFFATGGLDRLVRIWRMQDGADPVEVARLEGHESAISALAWRGDHLVSGDLGGHIRIWRLSTGS
jgi:WD40 repeat protein